MREKARAAAFVIGAVMSLLGGCLMGMAFPDACLFWVIAGVAGYVGCGSRAMTFWRMDEKIFEKPPTLRPPIPGKARWIAFWLLLGSLTVPARAEQTSVKVPRSTRADEMSSGKGDCKGLKMVEAAGVEPGEIRAIPKKS